MQKRRQIFIYFFLPGLRAHSHQNMLCCNGHVNLFLIPIVVCCSKHSIQNKMGWIAPSSTKMWGRLHFHSLTHRTPYSVLHYSTCTFWRCVKGWFTMSGTTTCKICYNNTNGVNGPQGSFALYLKSARSHSDIPGRDQIEYSTKAFYWALFTRVCPGVVYYTIVQINSHMLKYFIWNREQLCDFTGRILSIKAATAPLHFSFRYNFQKKKK